jgi:hypothetical protein
MDREDGSQMGKRKVRELCGPDGARQSVAVRYMAVLFCNMERNVTKPRLAPEERVLRA